MSFFTRLLQTTGLFLALMTVNVPGVRADDFVSAVGSDGAPGIGDPFGHVPAGPGGPATAIATDSSATGNSTASASATGGNGGGSIGEQDDTPGGDASASSTAMTTGSGDASSSAYATGGNYGVGGFGVRAAGGSATATADASATGSGSAIATAVAVGGVSGDDPLPVPPANATSSAETAQGALAQAQSTISFTTESEPGAESTAQTSFGGVSVQSNAQDYFSESGTVEAIAQGGFGQTSLTPDVLVDAISIALPDKAYATALIGGASNVAGALLGPGDQIFGAGILEDGLSTFDFRYQGDLLLGVIDGEVDGFSADTVINLGSLGPNVDLTIFGQDGGTFVIGGAVPESSTWAMMLVGFAGLGFLGWRGSRNTAAHAA
jgi:hypothetical protein